MDVRFSRFIKRCSCSRKWMWVVLLLALFLSGVGTSFHSRSMTHTPVILPSTNHVHHADAWDAEELLGCETCLASSFAPSDEESTWQNLPPADVIKHEGAEEADPRSRFQWFVEQRAYPLDTISAQDLLRAWRQARADATRARSVAAPRWENIGPAPMHNSQIGTQMVDVSGRVTALAIDPRNSNIVYLGAANGGVWKTTNGGNSWTPLTEGLPSQAIGAIAIAPSNPNVVYVGTGEATPGLDNYYGVGIYKSTNGGRTWQHVGEEVFIGLGIAKIIVHPSHPNVVYVATSRTGVLGPELPIRGIYRSTDGGRTWDILLGCRDCWGASDLVMHPSNPQILYAAFWSYGIFKSTDGGAHWTQLTNGLPDTNFGNVRLAISRSNPNVLYAGFDYRLPGQYVGGLVFKSTDGGESWVWLQDAPNYCTGQCWYDNVVAVHPRNSNLVYLGGSANYVWQPVFRVKGVVVRSTDGGITWEDLTPNDSPAHTLHPDVHAIAFAPSNPNIVWVGNDGGVWRSTDGGLTWQNRNTNLSTLQFTGIGVHPTNARVVYGGMQDNNKAKTTGNLVWQALDVGDGGFAAIDPFNPNIYYGSRYGISFQRNDKGGSAPVEDWPIKVQGIDKQDRALFYAPFALDPSTRGVIYYGTYRLYRSTNRGNTWVPISPDLTKGPESRRGRAAISAIAVAPSDPNTIYVGTSDGNVQVTSNRGRTWVNVTGYPLPDRWVSRIAVDPHNPQIAYVVFNGFNTHTPDTPGHVFKTVDRGQSWQNVSGDLPDIPVLSIALDPRHPGTVYIGTDIGVFRTVDDGRHWELFGTGLPSVPVVDLVYHARGRALIAATHGRSVYRLTLAGPPPTPTPTPTRPSITPMSRLFLPDMRRGVRQTPTPTPAGTVLPTATPTPRPTPTPTWTPTPSGPPPTPTPPPSPRVFFDDFSNPHSGWAVTEIPNCSFEYVADVYGIEVKTPNYICYSRAPMAPRANGVFQVEAAKLLDTDGSVYGLYFGGKSNAQDQLVQAYMFWVDPAQMRFALQKFDHGHWAYLVQWTDYDGIEPDDSINVLKVRRQGNRITLYINGFDVYSLQDASFPGNGETGVVAWSGYVNADMWYSLFDNFKVTVPTVIMQDDFSNPASGWPTGHTDACQAVYMNGRYKTVTQPNWACVFRAPIGPYPNGRFQVTAQREAGEIYPSAYGIFFGEDGSFSSLYAFLVIPDTQEYALALYEDEEWVGLTWDTADDDPWLFSSAIHAGTEPNVIKVVRDASHIHLFVNGTYLTTVQDASLLDQGYFGLINWPSSYAPGTVYFDDFQLVVWDEPSTGWMERTVTAHGLTVPRNFALPVVKDR